MSPQPRHRQPWSRRRLGVWYHNRDRKRGMYPFFDAVGPIMIMPYRCTAVYTPFFQLWIRRYCLIGCWKLSLNSQSYKDRVIEKLGQVSRWPDWLAIVMSQQGFCHWDTFLCDKNYMYDYITTWIIIRHVQNALPILTKRNIDVNTLDEFAGIYKATLFWG